MEMSPTALVLLGLLLAGWTACAAWLALAAQNKVAQAKAARGAVRRLTRIIDDSPAVPLLVRADGRIEGPDRLAGWLGLTALPGFLSELDAGDHGISAADLAELREAVRRTQKTAIPFSTVIVPVGSSRSLAVRGHLADPVVAS